MTHFNCEIICCCCARVIDGGQLQLNHSADWFTCEIVTMARTEGNGEMTALRTMMWRYMTLVCMLDCCCALLCAARCTCVIGIVLWPLLCCRWRECAGMYYWHGTWVLGLEGIACALRQGRTRQVSTYDVLLQAIVDSAKSVHMGGGPLTGR